jgi:hypothetical protein
MNQIRRKIKNKSSVFRVGSLYLRHLNTQMSSGHKNKNMKRNMTLIFFFAKALFMCSISSPYSKYFTFYINIYRAPLKLKARRWLVLRHCLVRGRCVASLLERCLLPLIFRLLVEINENIRIPSNTLLIFPPFLACAVSHFRDLN